MVSVSLIIIVCIGMAAGLLYHAITSRISKEEWAAYCSIYGIMLIIIGLEWRSLLYFYMVCFSFILLCSFFLKYANYEKEKASFLKKKRNGFCVINAELADIKHPTNSSMTVWESGKEAGVLSPHHKNDYEFTYYNIGGEKEYVMLIDKSEHLLRGFNYDYTLYQGDKIQLKINKIGHNKVALKSPSIYIETPIYKRENLAKDKEEIVMELRLFYEGFLLSCKEKERDIFVCFAYYAWLIIFGVRRRD